MDQGLWAWSRHPNYFGDSCVWVGVYLVACAVWPGVLTVLSPAAMVWFLVVATGDRLLERHRGQAALGQRGRRVALRQPGVDEAQPTVLHAQDAGGFGHLGVALSADVFDAVGIGLFGRKDGVEFRIGDIAALLGGLDHLLDGVVGKVEQRPVGRVRQGAIRPPAPLQHFEHLSTVSNQILPG